MVIRFPSGYEHFTATVGIASHLARTTDPPVTGTNRTPDPSKSAARCPIRQPALHAKLSRSLATAAALLACTAACAHPQQTAPPQASAPEVRLEGHNGKTHFRVGEPIQLDLVFSPSPGESFIVNATDYGDLADIIDITPKTGWVQWQGHSGHDYASAAPLTANAIRVPLVLNQGFVFHEPGHYDIRVTTSRLTRGTGVLNMTAVGPVTTDTLGIDLAPLPPEDEAALVRTLQAEIAGTTPDARGRSTAHFQAVQQLAALGGDDALRAKVALTLQEDDDMRRLLPEAMASTRNLPLQLTLLQQAWADPTHSPSFDILSSMQQTRALLRGESLAGWTMMVLPPDPHSEAVQAAAREHAADLDVLIRSLPARTGQIRSDALYLLMEDGSLTPAQAAIVKPLAIEDFPHMDTMQQRMLLETAHPAVHDAHLVPALRSMLEESPTDKDAIEDLIRFDPDGAKPYVVRAICNPQDVVPLEAVAALPVATLPEVDGCLADLLHVTPGMRSTYRWTVRADLAARFASPAVLPVVRPALNDPQNEGPVLALMLRYAPDEAVAHLKSTGWSQFNTFYEINKIFAARKATFPPQLSAWLRDVVGTGPPEAAGRAAYEVSRFGEPADRTVLESRLAQVRAAWKGREAEVAAANWQTEAGKAKQLDLELMSDLREAALWTETDTEAEQLAQGCLSDQCRIYGKPRPAPPHLPVAN